MAVIIAFALGVLSAWITLWALVGRQHQKDLRELAASARRLARRGRPPLIAVGSQSWREQQRRS